MSQVRILVVRKKLLCHLEVGSFFPCSTLNKYCQHDLSHKEEHLSNKDVTLSNSTPKGWSIRNGTRPPTTEADMMAKSSIKWGKALVIIVMSINLPLLYLVGELINPFKVWQKLAV